MTVVMRNTDTGEVKVLATDSNSVEYQDLIKARRSRDGRPLWEETGIHDYQGLKDRLSSGGIRPEDIGDAGQPFNIITGAPAPIDYTPSGDIDRLQATPTEIAGNAGRASLEEGEEFVPTIMQEDGSLQTTTKTSLQPAPVLDHTPPLDDPDMVDTTPEADEMDDEVDDLSPEDDSDEEEPDVAADDPRVVDLEKNNDQKALQDMASSRGLPTGGTKSELAQRIVEHDAGAPSAAPAGGGA